MSGSYCPARPTSAPGARRVPLSDGSQHRRRHRGRRPGLPALWLTLAALGGCSGAPGASGGSDGGPPDLAREQQPDLTPPPLWSDFPSQPITDPGVPEGAPALFKDSATGGTGPCLFEPESGAILPSNWIRPRFSFTPPPEQNLFEIRVAAKGELNDLIVYTTSTTWTMPPDVWAQLASHVLDEDIVITVRGGVWDDAHGKLLAGPYPGTTATFRIAPVKVSGSIFYWSSGRTTGNLRAAVIGEEKERVVSSGSGSKCQGCHLPTPDGQYLAYVESDGVAAGSPSGTIGMEALDGRPTLPTWLTEAGRQMMARPGQSTPSFSTNHYQLGDHRMLSVLDVDGRPEIIWTNLEATSAERGVGWDVLQRSIDDKRKASQPFFSHSGNQVVYVTANTVDGGWNVSDGDIFIVPWASGQGGEVQSVGGAHDNDYNEFAPALSGDDQVLAYNRVQSGEPSFANPKSEIWAVPLSSGGSSGDPVQLAANAPPTESWCMNLPRQALGNSAPRFAPTATTVAVSTPDGPAVYRYYWITFTSRRSDMTTPQVYIAAVVYDLTNKVIKQMGSAVRLWNQPEDLDNHAPVWDAAIPPP